MAITTTPLESAITQFAFRRIFVEELGWDRYDGQPLIVTVNGRDWILQGIAEKRGRVVYVSSEAAIPDYSQRCAIERMVTKTHHSHFIVFADTAQRRQVWQYARRVRTLDRAIRPRYFDMEFYRGQSPTALVNWLEHLRIDFAEEETLTSTDLDTKMDALAVERVTKTFYSEFSKKQQELAGQIVGLESADDCAWYASLLMNRLMFTYFIQSKKLLVGDEATKTPYLRFHLEKCEEADGDGSFFTYYKRFLLKFFHDGLGKRKEERTPEVQRLIGAVPYLNGGLFEWHRLEVAHDATLDVPNAAFHQIFDFFDKWDWQLDTRPDRKGNEINPDILGYIFEKYINQKQMGAYYTKEDITAYISKNTIIPYLFDAARERCAIAFVADGSVWGLLRADPDRYIFDAVRHGVDEPLPDAIAAGIADVAQRGDWNKPAPAPFALPTETWREHIARRQRCHEVRAKLAAGEITQINDLITYNLDIITFARDVIETCEGKDLVAAFYEAIAAITVLDPTCGSGAFLFAALNILAPLYDACLDRMEGFVREDDAYLEREGGRQRFADFRAVQDQVKKHSNNRDYFILKSIIVHNLYGVDIMAEAIEIAKLRLFLKLAAQVGDARDIEPLPDIDFNIRAGNTLIGYATRAEVEKAVKSRFDFDNTMARIDEAAEIYARALARFREQQTTLGGAISITEKQNLRDRLSQLNDELDRYLATEYGIEPSNPIAFEGWKQHYQAFHWYAEYHDIMENGGFKAVIGNPPYVEYYDRNFSYKLKNYETLPSANLYTCVVERCHNLLSSTGCHGMILPLSAFATKNMVPFIEGFKTWFPVSWVSFYHFRPSMLFSGGKVASIPTVIYIAKPSGIPTRFSTNIAKWNTENREILFDSLSYCQIEHPQDPENKHYYSKISNELENSIMQKVLRHKTVKIYLAANHIKNKVFYRDAGGLYWKVLVNFEWPYQSTTNKQCSFRADYDRDVFTALFNSSLIWWYQMVTFDTFHIKDYMLFGIRFTYPTDLTVIEKLKSLTQRLMADYQRNAEHLKRGDTGSYTIYAKKSKPIIDEIDRVLAKHYGFTEEELDFIINYDIKYRMGRDADAGDAEA